MKGNVLVRFTSVVAAFAFAVLMIPRSANASPIRAVTADGICFTCDLSIVGSFGLNGSSGLEHTDVAFRSFDGSNNGGNNPFAGGDIILIRGNFDAPFNNPLGDDDGDDPAPTPEPGSLLLLGSGLLSLGAVVRKFGLVR